jgi:hypothetical protein
MVDLPTPLRPYASFRPGPKGSHARPRGSSRGSKTISTPSRVRSGETSRPSVSGASSATASLYLLAERYVTCSAPLTSDVVTPERLALLKGCHAGTQSPHSHG